MNRHTIDVHDDTAFLGMNNDIAQSILVKKPHTTATQASVVTLKHIPSKHNTKVYIGHDLVFSRARRELQKVEKEAFLGRSLQAAFSKPNTKTTKKWVPALPRPTKAWRPIVGRDFTAFQQRVGYEPGAAGEPQELPRVFEAAQLFDLPQKHAGKFSGTFGIFTLNDTWNRAGALYRSTGRVNRPGTLPVYRGRTTMAVSSTQRKSSCMQVHDITT